MPRIRTIKPDFFADEKISKLKRDVRLLFIGLWVFSDDYGTVRSNPVWIKSNVFPYDEELRTNDVKTWLDALVKARMLEPFEYNGEGFYNIRTFCAHQKVDHPSKPLIPLEVKPEILSKLSPFQSEHSRDTLETLDPEVVSSKGKEIVSSNDRAIALVGDDSPPKLKKSDYEKLCDEINGKDANEVVGKVKEFLIQKPDFLEPYVDYWNIAVSKTNIPTVKRNGLSDSRKKQLRTRLKEDAFDFIEIIRKIRGSSKLKKESQWFSFDWVFENDKNYLKIIEGNYD